MSFDRYYYTHRTLCSVLEEMRKTNKTRNYSSLLSLIEEAQILGNRMEAGLSEKKDLREMHEEWTEMKAKIKVLRKELKALEKQVETAKRKG